MICDRRVMVIIYLRGVSMKKIFKWSLLGAGVLGIVMVAAVFLIPRFVDVQQYKPRVEQMVANATGRPFSMGGDIELSLFPWVGISLSDLQLGNPPGFEGPVFVSVDAFNVKVKLLPLLSRDVQVKAFVLTGPKVVLVKGADGVGNWENPGAEATVKGHENENKKAAASEKNAKKESVSPGTLPVTALMVERFSISHGSVEWHDKAQKTAMVVSDVDLQLKDISLDAPVAVRFSARVDDQPVSLQGQVGPVGNAPGQGDLPLNLTIKLLKELSLAVKGKVVDAVSTPRFQFDLDLTAFSPRTVLAQLGKSEVLPDAPDTFNRFSFKGEVSGDPTALTLTNGEFVLDESKMILSAKIKEFARPNVIFDMGLDAFDLDRYLPSSKTAANASQGDGDGDDVNDLAAASAPTGRQKTADAPALKKMDYTPLRQLILDGRARVEKLSAGGMVVRNVEMAVTGSRGQFNLAPFAMDLYQGRMTSSATLDVRKDVPTGTLQMKTDGIQVGPLLQDAVQKDFLEGALKGDVKLTFKGDEPQTIKRNLNGEGELVFTDGAVVGVDLAGMVRNIKAKFGLGEPTAEKPRTDFSELNAPFTLTRGVFDTSGITMRSPLIRLLVLGNADLVKETLDFKVQPKFVATLKGQGDTQNRTGVTIPVLVSGTFEQPKFRPDMEALLETSIPQAQKLKEEVKDLIENRSDAREQLKDIENKAKDLLKGFSLGQ